MKNRVIRNVFYCLAAAGGLLGALCAGTAAAQPRLTVDPDGTVHVSELTMPPSDYWSPEFRAAFARRAAAVAAAASNPGSLGHTPTAGAAKVDWDAYDAACARSAAPTIDWERANYAVDVAETTVGGVRVGIATPKEGVPEANRGRVLIELRGGACGGLDGEAEAMAVASFGKIKVLAVDYRPAPRNKYPASVEDVVAVYKVLLQQYKPESIGIFGTSGGGMLTTQVLPWLQSEGLPRPGAAGVFWSGITNSPYPFGKFGDSLLWELSGIPQGDHTTYNAMIAQLAVYMKDVSSDDPRGYPGSSDSVLAKFPPTLFVTGSRALDMSAATTSHARLLGLGVDSYLYVMEGGWHAASVGTRGSPEERAVNTYIGRWFNQHLAQ